MEIKLSCDYCDGDVNVTKDTLCKLWFELYAEHNPGTHYTLSVDVNCESCGAKTVYESPIFAYIFSLMFEDYLATENSD